jgi:hypothetical protein
MFNQPLEIAKTGIEWAIAEGGTTEIVSLQSILKLFGMKVV